MVHKASIVTQSVLILDLPLVTLPCDPTCHISHLCILFNLAITYSSWDESLVDMLHTIRTKIVAIASEACGVDLL